MQQDHMLHQFIEISIHEKKTILEILNLCACLHLLAQKPEEDTKWTLEKLQEDTHAISAIPDEKETNKKKIAIESSNANNNIYFELILAE